MATAAERLLERLNRISTTRNDVAERLAIEQAAPLDQSLAAATVSPVSQGSVDAMAAQAANAGAPTSAGFVAEFNRSFYVDPAKQASQQLAISQANEEKRVSALKTQLDGIDAAYVANQNQLKATMDIADANRRDAAEARAADRLDFDKGKYDDGAETRRLQEELAGAKAADYPKQQEAARAAVVAADENRVRDDGRADRELRLREAASKRVADIARKDALDLAKKKGQYSLAYDLLNSDRAAELSAENRSPMEVTNILFEESKSNFEKSDVMAAMNKILNADATTRYNLETSGGTAKTNAPSNAAGTNAARAALGLVPAAEEVAPAKQAVQTKKVSEPVGIDGWSDGSPYSKGNEQ